MKDHELLELAAKAAGFTICKWWESMDSFIIDGGDWWNPLLSDGDALRLAVNLNMDVMTATGHLVDGTPVVSVVFPIAGDYEAISEPIGDDRQSGIRRAIVRAAAEIGSNKEQGDGGGV